MKFFKFLLITFLASVSVTAVAQSPLPDSSTIILDPKDETINPTRHKVPSMQQISCTYEDGTLIIQFHIPEGLCCLSVTNLATNTTRQYTFDSSEEATIYVGTLNQAYIEVVTESGHSYEGWLGQ